jgi:hypothetical protein
MMYLRAIGPFEFDAATDCREAAQYGLNPARWDDIRAVRRAARLIALASSFRDLSDHNDTDKFFPDVEKWRPGSPSRQVLLVFQSRSPLVADHMGRNL